MAVFTINGNNGGSWDKARAVAGKYHVVYYPNSRILRMFNFGGGTVAETGAPEGVRDFDAFVAENGEVQVLFSSFNNDVQPWPWKLWTTGVFVAAAPAPAPAPAGTTNAAKAAQIIEIARTIT